MSPIFLYSWLTSADILLSYGAFISTCILSLSVFLILKSLEENVVYFQSPTEVKELAELNKKKIRLWKILFSIKINWFGFN